MTIIEKLVIKYNNRAIGEIWRTDEEYFPWNYLHYKSDLEYGTVIRDEEIDSLIDLEKSFTA